jgi:hypothetical protein
MIGITKPNRLLPADTSSGVSLREKIAVNKSRKIIAAARPDQKTLIKYMIDIPIKVMALPMTNSLTFSHKKNGVRDITRAISDTAATPTNKILRILLRRVSSGSAVEIVIKRFRKVIIAVSLLARLGIIKSNE